MNIRSVSTRPAAAVADHARAIVNGALFGAVVTRAHAAGLLAALDGSPRSVQELAAALRLDARALALILDVLVAFDVAVRTPTGVRASAALTDLERTLPGGLRSMLALGDQLGAFLATGATVGRMDGDLAQRAASYAPSVPALGRLFAAPAAALAGALPPAERILDIGAGSGVWSLAMASRSESARVTAVDLVPVLEAFRGAAVQAGLADRCASLGADYRRIELSGTWDRVVLANVLHLETAEEARRLLQRASCVVAPGGDIVVVDSFAQGEDRDHALYALTLALRTAHGTAHSEETLRSWLEQLGFRGRPLLDIGATPSSMRALVATAR